jgi:hypothetical protein
MQDSHHNRGAIGLAVRRQPQRQFSASESILKEKPGGQVNEDDYGSPTPPYGMRLVALADPLHRVCPFKYPFLHATSFGGSTSKHTFLQRLGIGEDVYLFGFGKPARNG